MMGLDPLTRFDIWYPEGSSSISPPSRPDQLVVEIEEYHFMSVINFDGENGAENRTDFFANLDGLRISIFDTAESVREILSAVPVRKPNRTDYFRTHPDPNMCLPTTVLVDRDEQDEIFFVPPDMRGVLAGELKHVLLQVTITRQGVLLLWPINLPLDGRHCPWAETSRQAAELAKSSWVRMASDRPLGAYRIFRAEGEIPEPRWPDKTFGELLQIAFRGRIIDSEDHPVIRRLRGL
jgi:hypothetical protein